MSPSRPKICLVSSVGGHLSELRALKRAYAKYDHFFVLNDRVALPEDMSGRTYFIRHAERDLLVLVNLREAWRILRRERPTLILSTGAGPAVPFALLGRILGIPSLFIEIAANVTTPSLTGRMMYLLAKRVFYQWPSLGRHYPRGIHGGPLLWSS